MKHLVLLLGIFLSLSSWADSGIRYSSEDFDLFPLAASNSQFIEGVWVGKSVLINIEEMNYTPDDRVYMWVTITNMNTRDKKAALLYYHQEHGGYELFVFDAGISVPLEIMIFKYTDKDAFERRMKCSRGGYVMRLSFALGGNESQTVNLQRETCSEK